MGKKLSERTHKKQIDASRSHMSGEQIAQMNNQRRHANRIAYLEQRTKEAEERNKKWRALTPQQQLQELDRRLGKGVGAIKTRNKINAALQR